MLFDNCENDGMLLNRNSERKSERGNNSLIVRQTLTT